MKFKIPPLAFLAAFFVLLFPVLASAKSEPQVVWDLEHLYEAPAWRKSETAPKDGMTGLLYESIPYNEDKVEVFAYYSAPEGEMPKGGWPAVVCVHGGGGTAFDEWVRKWNEHGYAAISMDLEGHVPIKKKNAEKNYNRLPTDHPGPQRVGVFNDYDRPVEQQWYFHAVAQIIQAHSLIRSFPEVNADKTGVTGISWGGNLTSTVMGLDDRFKFAIPVYGCGFLPDSDGNQGENIKPGKHTEVVNRYYDGSAYFDRVKMPTFWVNGTNDKHFPMPSTQQSAQSVKGKTTVRIELEMKHGHRVGWAREEIYAFANSVLGDEPVFTRFGSVESSANDTVSVPFKSTVALKSAELLFTKDQGVWPKRKWETAEAVVIASENILVANIPDGATACFFNATDERGLMNSSEFVEIPVRHDQYWVLLESTDAKNFSEGRYWDFSIERAGNYVVQVVHDGGTPQKVKFSIGAQEFEEVLEKDYRINLNQRESIVSELNKPVVFKKEGIHRLKLKSNTSLKQIRLIPHFKNAFGSGNYHSQWQAMHQSPEKQAALEWFKEAKFGMFIHWGIYSAAGGMWKNTRINDAPFPGPKVAEWLMSAFQLSRDEYAQLADEFCPDQSFAENIAQLAKDAGMKYIVITSKHHDGFALFDSACSDFDIADQTSYEGDAIKDLYDACQKVGLEFGVYYSHGNDWRDGTDGNYANVKARNDSLGIFTHPTGKNLWDPSDNSHAEYLETKAYPQIEELVKMMPNLRVIWFDGEGLITEEQSFQFYKKVFDLNPNILVNRRVGYDFGDYLDAGDNKIPGADEVLTKHWETCGTTNNSWGYKVYDQDWKSTKELLYWFIDIASKGGNYLLNIGPDGKGGVPEACQANLREMGRWVKTNKEAIFGTTRWKILHEGQSETEILGTGHRAAKGFTRRFSKEDFWFTYRQGTGVGQGDTVYAISLVSGGEKFAIRSLGPDAGKITSVRVLGVEHEIKWEQRSEGLIVDLKNIQTDENGFVIAVGIEDDLIVRFGNSSEYSSLFTAINKFESAWAKGDFTTVESFFTEDAKRLHTEPYVWDRKEIKRYFAERAKNTEELSGNTPNWKTGRDYLDIRVEGNIAYDIFTTDRFKALHIWEKQDDGSWMIKYDMGMLNYPE